MIWRNMFWWYSKFFHTVYKYTYLNFKSEVFLHILDNHDQIWQFNSQSLSRVSRTSDISGTNIGSHNLQNKTLNVWICDSLDMSISHFFVPNLQWFTPNAVQDRQEPRLKGVLEHAGVKIQSWYIKSNFGFVLGSRSDNRYKTGITSIWISQICTFMLWVTGDR